MLPVQDYCETHNNIGESLVWGYLVDLLQEQFYQNLGRFTSSTTFYIFKIIFFLKEIVNNTYYFRDHNSTNKYCIRSGYLWQHNRILFCKQHQVIFTNESQVSAKALITSA